MSTAVATATAVEIVRFEPESRRALAWFDALETGARGGGIDVSRTSDYRGTAPWLLLWGPGAPARGDLMRRHIAGGGHVVALDLAYWDRDRKARVSFDAAHPQAWVMRKDLPRARFDAERIPVADRWKPNGPILFAGLGDKARVQYGAETVDRWESSMARACRARWPNRPMVYRKKKSTSAVPDWAPTASGQPIDQVLAGCSLVVTWHSNVAVDAIRMGVPVICRDGASAAVCPSELGAEDPQPLPLDVRDRFLGNLAWFQWGPEPSEIRGFWRFVQEQLS